LSGRSPLAKVQLVGALFGKDVIELGNGHNEEMRISKQYESTLALSGARRMRVKRTRLPTTIFDRSYAGCRCWASCRSCQNDSDVELFLIDLLWAAQLFQGFRITKILGVVDHVQKRREGGPRSIEDQVLGEIIKDALLVIW